jgi:F-box-like
MPTNDQTNLSPVNGLQARSQYQTNDGTILKLPVELLLALFQYLDYRGLSALSATCRFLNQIVTESLLLASRSDKFTP